jgi:hypothetical protein
MSTQEGTILRDYRGLVCANKFFCADLYSLEYAGLNVDFKFQLSKRAIYTNP